MNNQRLHHTNSYIKVGKERTENMAVIMDLIFYFLKIHMAIKIEYNKIQPYSAKNGSQIKELMHPEDHISL
jgi:hypothetical protein